MAAFLDPKGTDSSRTTCKPRLEHCLKGLQPYQKSSKLHQHHHHVHQFSKNFMMLLQSKKCPSQHLSSTYPIPPSHPTLTTVTFKDSAFAALTRDGHVVTWGGRHGFGRGGNSLTVQRQLVDVQRLSATDGAFAALLGDGRVPWKANDSGCFFVVETSLQPETGG